MIFDLDRHKLRVAAELALTAAWTGALTGIFMTWVDPKDFNIFSAGDWHRLLQVASMGAFIGILNLLRSLPRNPVSFSRREDPAQVIKAAENLGVVEPERLARQRRQTDKVRRELYPPPKDKGGDF